MRNPTWEKSLEPQIAQAREELRSRDPRIVADNSGAVYYEIEEGQGRFQVRFFGRPYTISWPELEVFDPQGQSCPNPVQAALLQYLVLADGTPLTHHWVSLRELPNGAFYERAFQGYSGNLVVRHFKNDIERFRQAAQKLGGEPVELGDAAFRFWALPRIPLAVVYWSGGEEFPASAHVLFDSSAGHYHHLEMLAHLGAMICDQLIQAA
uniref:Hypothetical conserved protein n=2 Tax=Candidatus Bipolaricaulota TaxID=67810 RepID=H5SJ98_9BACT|nr:hypothetical conserved protein [uncultured Acetothermia bacterium]BAL57903.1 hypothetical conserved protein [uncultured Acetothermia bacterium]BAL59026.1 hypothetical conserved protein [Candidatus Acetothermum autotrophicum]